MINRDFFFHYTRQHLFGGSLKQSQVDGMNAILDEWDANYKSKDDRWLAYMMATAYHETDRKMQAIEEYGRGKGHAYGKPDPVTGQRYFGRGLVQLTWKYNYEAAQKKFGQPLVTQPDLALNLDIAIKIMFWGMINGIFTGKKLSNYFDGTKADWVNARRIINGLDKANLISGYGHQFYAAISHTT
jgi:predicted chitinase